MEGSSSDVTADTRVDNLTTSGLPLILLCKGLTEMCSRSMRHLLYISDALFAFIYHFLFVTREVSFEECFYSFCGDKLVLFGLQVVTYL